MILVGVSGKRGAGKDLLASILAKNFGYVNFPFAEALKEGVRRDFNLTKEHTDGKLKEAETNYVISEYYDGPSDKAPLITTKWTPRQIMIEYGQFFREFDPMWWVKKTFDKINSIPCFITNQSIIKVTISDVRFRNEAEYIKSQGGYLVRLERDPSLSIYKGDINDSSETELDDYQGFDFILDEDLNETPEDLERFAKEINQYFEIEQRNLNK